MNLIIVAKPSLEDLEEIAANKKTKQKLASLKESLPESSDDNELVISILEEVHRLCRAKLNLD